MSGSRSAFVLLSAAVLMVGSSCKNRPPAIPQAPEGPVNCYPNQSYDFAVTPTDPNGDNVAVRVDWGDSVVSDWSEWSSSGIAVTVSHSWADTGAYLVRAQAEDKKLLISDWSEALSVQVLPRPETPAVPSGPVLCFKDTSYTYKSVATDRYGDSVSIRFDWGTDTSDWSSFVVSGETVARSVAWSHVGTHKVKAQARDPKLHASNWSQELAVEVILRTGPDQPDPPSGPPRGGVGPESVYNFTAYGKSSTSPLVAVRFDWGNGDTSDWGQFMASGEATTMGHAWLTAGIFAVRAQAKDTGSALSPWSFAHTITIRPPDTLLIWRYQIKPGAAVAANYSSPAIGPDGTIYVGSQDDYLYALDSNGALKWRLQTGDIVRSSPAIGPDGTIYVGSYDNHLYAINPNGTIRWTYATDGDIPSSPAIAADGTIIFGSRDKFIYALNPDSTLKWSDSTSREVWSSPAIAADGTVYCGSNDDYLYALTPNGVRKWRYPTDRDIEGSPAIAADGTVYVGSTDKCLYAVNPDGSTRWQYLTGEDVNSSPAVSADGTIYFGSNDNNLYALKPDKTLVWSYLTDSDIESSPTIGPDGKVYFVSFDGYLYKLKGTSPLAGSTWPKFRHDLTNNGRVGAR